MPYQFPHRRELKFQAKRWIGHPTAMRTTLLVVGLLVASFGVKYLLDANLTYALADLNHYQDTTTGIYFNDNGFSLIFRMDLTQLVIAIPLTYTQIAAFLAVNLVCFLILAPLRVGLMAVYWAILRGEHPAFSDLFPWLTQARRLGKSLVVEFVLQAGVRLVGLVCTLPSFYLYYLFYSNVTSLDQVTTQMSLLHSLAFLLAVIAAVFAFWLHCTFLPVRYCLAAHPEFTLGQTFVRGLRSTKGWRGRFFRFRLSMVPWYFFSQVSYHSIDLYAMPYTSMASMLYIQEIARAKNAQTQIEPL